MVQKCANPACGEPFLYFRTGKIYRIVRRDAMPRASHRRERGEAEHFWLCGRCSAKLTVTLLADGSIAVAETCRQQDRENNLVQGRSRRAKCMPRILVLDVDLKTLGFIEEMLQDSGFSAITCTSVVEAITLLATGFFDVFVAIDRPAQSHTGATLSALATARVHCKSCLCWRVEDIKQQCTEFIGHAVEGELGADDGNHDTSLLTSHEREVAGEQSNGATA